ncbi:MAG TPA: tripartite tricarboxylate transporter substrate binding protein [Atribacteraceae bacterium]|nr:tripartite tricarboxylate transporter substrate binding protein [Atribacteraceae bacterium]
MIKKYVLGLLVALLMMSLSVGVAFGADWPTRPINIIVFSAAGGSTDLSNRAIAEAIKPYLGVEVVVSNMPGALGGTATAYVWSAPRDGYIWYGASEGFLGLAVLGAHHTTAEDWELFLVGGTPGVISVRKDSPFEDFQQLLDAVAASPGGLTIATSIPGCIWNIQYLTLEKYGGYDLEFIPYPGSHPSIVAALAGEIDVVWTGLGEQSEFLKAGELRPLAIYDTKPHEFAGMTIPPITDYVPELVEIMPLLQFVGFGLPSDTPPEILEKVTEAFHQAMQKEPVQRFAETVASTLYGYSGEKARELAKRQQAIFAWLLWEEGLARVSPEEFGIPNPFE